MTQTLSLLFGVHAHQPVGNFRSVVDDAHARCYRPFLQTLHRYPGFRFAVHFSGWLLDELMARYPEDLALLKDMVARGQVEMFGAGDTEPVLAVIPYRDRVGQLNVMSDKLERELGQRPEGAWLTERVWEATVVPALADTGIQYVTVDDYHFLCTGKTSAELTGYFSTEEDGRRLDMFPISEALRYRIPFSPAQEAVAYLESLADRGEDCAAVYFDDIEKFGIWPETYQWVYEKRWLEQFIEGVLASKKIATRRYSDYHRQSRTRGVVYLPTTSYIEMNEWTLPARAAHQYAELVHTAKCTQQFDKLKAFLRGGFWKNFFSRYPESNWMHKRMLQLSGRVAALGEKATPAMTELLYRAQANDAYWHGLFGGLYLPHLRRAVFSAIVELEAMLDQVAPRPAKCQEDLDLDGHEEIFLHNARLQAVIRLDGSASIHELDAYELSQNFGDTLARQSEHYHHKLENRPTASGHNADGIASAHDRFELKHDIRPEDMAVDGQGMTLFRDSLLDQDGRLLPLHYMPRSDDTRSDRAVFCGMAGAGQMAKTLRLEGGTLAVEYHPGKDCNGRLVTAIALAMPSCDGPAGRFVHRGEIPCGFGQSLEVAELHEIWLEDLHLGARLKLACNRPARFTSRPHQTVSQSEAGFEKIMQAVLLTLEWPLDGGGILVTLTVEKIPGNA